VRGKRETGFDGRFVSAELVAGPLRRRWCGTSEEGHTVVHIMCIRCECPSETAPGRDPWTTAVLPAILVRLSLSRSSTSRVPPTPDHQPPLIPYLASARMDNSPFDPTARSSRRRPQCVPALPARRSPADEPRSSGFTVRGRSGREPAWASLDWPRSRPSSSSPRLSSRMSRRRSPKTRAGKPSTNCSPALVEMAPTAEDRSCRRGASPLLCAMGLAAGLRMRRVPSLPSSLQTLMDEGKIHRGLPRLGSPRRKFPKGPKIPLFHGRGPRIPVFPRGIRNGPVAENPGAVYPRGIRSGSVAEAPASLVRPRYSREFIDNFFANLKVKGASAGGRSESNSL
jgi:hypothetical protein